MSTCSGKFFIHHTANFFIAASGMSGSAGGAIR